jgi:GAF domain-containing protein
VAGDAGGRANDSGRHLDERLRRLVDAAIATTAAERGFLLLLQDDGEVRVRTARDLHRNDLGPSPTISRSVTEKVLRDNRALVMWVVSDPEADYTAEVAARRLSVVMCAPVTAGGPTRGVLYVDSDGLRRGKPTDADLRLLDAQAGVIGMVIEGHRGGA